MARMKCETCGKLVIDGPADHEFYDGSFETFDKHLLGCPAPSLSIVLPSIREVLRE